MKTKLGSTRDGATKAVRNDLLDQPGYLFRRGQQICVSAFYETLGPEITPLQYGALRMIREHPGIDQITLAKVLALDSSTTAEVATRLEHKGLVKRELQVVMRRQRLLFLTPEGRAVLSSLIRRVNRLRRSILSRLEPNEQEELMRLLRRFVEADAGSDLAAPQG